MVETNNWLLKNAEYQTDSAWFASWPWKSYKKGFVVKCYCRKTSLFKKNRYCLAQQTKIPLVIPNTKADYKRSCTKNRFDIINKSHWLSCKFHLNYKYREYAPTMMFLNLPNRITVKYNEINRVYLILMIIRAKCMPDVLTGFFL